MLANLILCNLKPVRVYMPAFQQHVSTSMQASTHTYSIVFVVRSCDMELYNFELWAPFETAEHPSCQAVKDILVQPHINSRPFDNDVITH